MRKGDEKRQELLNAAERLFCQKGYEATSIQDILNELHLSKGGFYHHFASKEEVIRALCDRRADRAVAFTTDMLNTADSPMGRINAILYGFMPLRREETSFASLLLPLIGTPEGRGIAMAYQDALADCFMPLLRAEIAAAAAVGVIYPPVKDMEPVVLHTVNRCWMDVAAQLAEAIRMDRRLDRLALLTILEKYRRAIEVLLDAPYGSVEIIRVEEWDEVARLLRTPQSL